MSGSIEVHVEKVPLGFWTYLQRSAGHLPETPLYQILNWVLEQVNLGNCKIVRDQGGDAVSLTLGRDAVGSAQTIDDASEEAIRRLEAINFAGVLAQSRESGIEPEIAHVSKMASEQITEWGRRNTEFHYAFELIKVLGALEQEDVQARCSPDCWQRSG